MSENVLAALNNCHLCPRNCGVDRTKQKGFCGENATVRIARAELHYWEEPCISGKNGSGTVFFSGCSLKCCFCQNYEISALGKGFELTIGELADVFLMLQKRGAENINLVNPTHFVPQIVLALGLCKDRLKIPVVYNSGGYDNVKTIKMLSGKVDVFLPDLKYCDHDLSTEYSLAADYFEVATKAIKEMVRIVGKPQYNESGMMKSGVIVRHLVLPSNRHDSLKIVKWLGENFANDEILLSLMCQFTPVYKAKEHSELCRRTSTFEYNSVLDEADKYGFLGYRQQKSSAKSEYIPEFFDYKYF